LEGESGEVYEVVEIYLLSRKTEDRSRKTFNLMNMMTAFKKKIK
jgi:hypothetical protein